MREPTIIYKVIPPYSWNGKPKVKYFDNLKSANTYIESIRWAEVDKSLFKIQKIEVEVEDGR